MILSGAFFPSNFFVSRYYTGTFLFPFFILLVFCFIAFALGFLKSFFIRLVFFPFSEPSFYVSSVFTLIFMIKNSRYDHEIR